MVFLFRISRRLITSLFGLIPKSDQDDHPLPVRRMQFRDENQG
jgi:hypothetical protein